jgi:hypothetical protein
MLIVRFAVIIILALLIGEILGLLLYNMLQVPEIYAYGLGMMVAFIFAVYAVYRKVIVWLLVKIHEDLSRNES